MAKKKRIAHKRTKRSKIMRLVRAKMKAHGSSIKVFNGVGHEETNEDVSNNTNITSDQSRNNDEFAIKQEMVKEELILEDYENPDEPMEHPFPEETEENEDIKGNIEMVTASFFPSGGIEVPFETVICESSDVKIKQEILEDESEAFISSHGVDPPPTLPALPSDKQSVECPSPGVPKVSPSSDSQNLLPKMTAKLQSLLNKTHEQIMDEKSSEMSLVVPAVGLEKCRICVNEIFTSHSDLVHHCVLKHSDGPSHFSQDIKPSGKVIDEPYSQNPSILGLLTTADPLGLCEATSTCCSAATTPSSYNAATTARYSAATTPSSYNAATTARYRAATTPSSYNGATTAIYRAATTSSSYNGATTAIYRAATTPSSYNAATTARYRAATTPSSYNGATTAIYRAATTPSSYNAATTARYRAATTPSSYNAATTARYRAATTPSSYNAATTARYRAATTPSNYNAATTARYRAATTPSSYNAATTARYRAATTAGYSAATTSGYRVATTSSTIATTTPTTTPTINIGCDICEEIFETIPEEGRKATIKKILELIKFISDENVNPELVNFSVMRK